VEGNVRVSTAFNKILGIVGATVASVIFTPEGTVVGLRRRRTKLVCPCGWKTGAVYDRSVRRWRHLDLAGSKLWVEAEIRRLHCRRCERVRGPVPVTPATCRTSWLTWLSGWIRPP
jgi:transposase